MALRNDEKLGLGVAIAAHVALFAVLLIRPPAPDVVQPPERIEVTISDEVGLTSTSPQPQSRPAQDIAPQLGEPAPSEPEPAPPLPEPAPQPEPAPAPRPAPRAVEQPEPRPVAKPVPRPKPKPAPRATQRPAPQPRAVERPAPPKPAAKPAARPSARPATTATRPSRPAARPATRPAEKSGASRIGNDFLEGVQGGQSTAKASAPPAAAVGPQVRASLASAISRQLKPRWQAPQGPDAEELVTVLSFSLNRDGSLAGQPTVVRQLGITDINRNQADRHAEQAVRAVQLAAPFNLPAEYYDAWKRVSAFRFDKRLSQ